MKTSLIVILLLTSLSTQSQIKIGQPAYETLAFLEYVSRSKPMYISVDYRNGRIAEIITYIQHQFFYDLDVTTDEIGRYIMDENGRYAYNIMQYPKLPLSFVTEKLEKYYGNNKIEDYYFTDHYDHFMTPSLINQHASVIHGQSSYSLLPESVSNEIQKRKKLIEQEKRRKE